MKVLIINGPNLNLVGKRQPEIYGTESFDEIIPTLQKTFPKIEILYFQSNHEGAIIDRIHEAREESLSGLLINCGAFSHYSYAIHDALLTLEVTKLEIHLSHIYAREPFRRTSVTAAACDGVLAGLGMEGYRMGLEFLTSKEN